MVRDKKDAQSKKKDWVIDDEGQVIKPTVSRRAEPRTYVVQAGDSLSKIAKEVYDDASRWPEIFEANKDQIQDPDLIHPGQELRIP